MLLKKKDLEGKKLEDIRVTENRKHLGKEYFINIAPLLQKPVLSCYWSLLSQSAGLRMKLTGGQNKMEESCSYSSQ